MEYKVNLRRGKNWKVKPVAEQIDGKIFNFREGWTIEKDDSSIYIGEIAMLPDDKNYPHSAPHWIASGDLKLSEQNKKECLCGQYGKDDKDCPIHWEDIEHSEACKDSPLKECNPDCPAKPKQEPTSEDYDLKLSDYDKQCILENFGLDIDKFISDLLIKDHQRIIDWAEQFNILSGEDVINFVKSL
jgi:hypothetical protein